MRRFDLSGSWQVAKADSNDWFAATVPGCIHTDLLSAGRIPDPFFRDNEDRLRWIGETEWVYKRTFKVPAELFGRDKVLLRAEGLDTLAVVSINGTEIGRADNMFRTWEWDVKSLLTTGENEIVVRFASPVPYIAKRQAERKIPSWGCPKDVHGRAWVRKEPCNFGWDWGPVLVTCGIWRAISLIGFSEGRLKEIQVRQDHSVKDQVGLNVNVGVEVGCARACGVRIDVSLEGVPVSHTTAAVAGGKAHAVLGVANPKLWWPNNLGPQPLYDVTVSLFDGNHQTRDVQTLRIGLRTLRLDRHPDQWGESFQFVVNGVPFFAKGANWIPADSFATRITPDHYRRLIQDAAAANMNFLRVWGGGIYESDLFYSLCDELGICLWHDFMFACSTYPTFDDAFMKNVKAEVEDNVRRIRHHPSIALWCGNNELEQGLVGDDWNERQMSWDDYGKLFDKLLPETLCVLDPERDYWPCSPHTPKPGDRKNFNDPDRGDAHLWSVWHGRQPFEWYRTCTHRFNSEFGFQSFPEPKTVYGYTEPRDRNVTTYVMEHHQRSNIGNTAIMQYMLDWFRLPTSFANTLWLSQILQGMAIKYACEHWRRAMPRGMGTLYWQYDDCWPVASWASVDYHGRWKALHYMARDFFAPLLVSGVENLEAGTVEVHVTNDLLEPRTGEVRWVLTNVAGRTLSKGTLPVHAPHCASRKVGTVDVKRFLAKHGPRDLLFWLELRVKKATVGTNLVLFSRPKHLELDSPVVDAQIVPRENGVFEVVLSAPKPALWVWLELKDIDARFANNFFHLRPGVPVSVTVTPAKKLSPARFVRLLSVSSLVDTYA